MDRGQNVPAPTGDFFHSQNCNFPEESFILSSPCNSVVRIYRLPIDTESVRFAYRNRAERSRLCYICVCITSYSVYMQQTNRNCFVNNLLCLISNIKKCSGIICRVGRIISACLFEFVALWGGGGLSLKFLSVYFLRPNSWT